MKFAMTPLVPTSFVPFRVPQVQHADGAVGLEALRQGLTNEIGTPDPQIEPHITSLDKCNIT